MRKKVIGSISSTSSSPKIMISQLEARTINQKGKLNINSRGKKEKETKGKGNTSFTIFRVQLSIILMQDELDPIQVSPKFKENLIINSKKKEGGEGVGLWGREKTKGKGNTSFTIFRVQYPSS